jgi:tetratricopeptide (TPR) repeat protein
MAKVSFFLCVACAIISIAGCGGSILYSGILGGGPSIDTDAVMAEAVECGALRDYSTAIGLLDKIIERYPNDSVALTTRGMMFCNSGELEKAITDFSAAIECDPDNSDAYSQRAQAHQFGDHSGWAKKALADTEISIRFQQHNPLAHTVRGYAFTDQEQLKIAVDEFSLAIRQDSKSYSAFAGRAWVYAKMSKFYQANLDVNKALKLNPPVAEHKSLKRFARQISAAKSDGKQKFLMFRPSN